MHRHTPAEFRRQPAPSRPNSERSLRAVSAPELPAERDAARFVLVVDDDRDARELTSLLLRRVGFRCIEAASGDEALHIVETTREPIDAMVLDVMMPGVSGFEVLRRLGSTPTGAAISVVIVSASATADDDVVQGFQRGAVDYVTKPFTPAVLAARVQAACERARVTHRLREALRDSEHQAATDPLTGLFNRRHLQARLAEVIAHSHRHAEPYSVLLCDVDHFKSINDRFGHERGDQVLAHFSASLVRVLRQDDTAFRLGGDEFVALLRACDIDRAMDVARRLRAKLGPLELDCGTTVEVTFSAGVAGGGKGDSRGDGLTPEKLLARADAALYEAKRRGRDRVEVDSGADASGEHQSQRGAP